MAPSSADQLFALAIRHHPGGQLAEAEQVYREILEINPHHAGALHYRGVAALRQGRSVDAADLIKRSLAQHEDPQAHYHAGLALAGLSRFAEAAVHNRRAITLKPDFIDAHINLGNVLKALGHLNEAAACYRHIIAIKPALPAAYYNLAGVFLEKGDADAAIATFERALSADPTYLPARIGHALALRQQGRSLEALTILCRVLNRNAATDAKTFVRRMLQIACALQASSSTVRAVDCGDHGALDTASQLDRLRRRRDAHGGPGRRRL